MNVDLHRFTSCQTRKDVFVGEEGAGSILRRARGWPLSRVHDDTAADAVGMMFLRGMLRTTTHRVGSHQDHSNYQLNLSQRRKRCWDRVQSNPSERYAMLATQRSRFGMLV